MSERPRPYYRSLAEMALLKIHNDVMLVLDDGNEVILLLLDLSSAFDTIDHSFLLYLLEYCFAISGTVLTWFASYLNQC